MVNRELAYGKDFETGIKLLQTKKRLTINF
jgi:hypothetical protein